MPSPVNFHDAALSTRTDSTSQTTATGHATPGLREHPKIEFPDIDWNAFDSTHNPIASFEISAHGQAFLKAVQHLTQEAEGVTSQPGLLQGPRNILQRTGVSAHSLPPATGETGHQCLINNAEQELEVLKLTVAAFKEIGEKIHELRQETNPAKKNLKQDRLTRLLSDVSEEWSACAEGVKSRLTDFLMTIRTESTIQNSAQSAKQRLVNTAATQFWNGCWDSRDPDQRALMLGNQQHFINGVYKELGHRYGLDKEVVDNYVLSEFVQQNQNELIAVLDETLTESAIARVLATDYMDRLVRCLGGEQWTRDLRLEDSWVLFNQKLKDAQTSELTPAFGEVLQSQIIELDGENFRLQNDLGALSEQLVRNARTADCLSGVATPAGDIRFDVNDGYVFFDPKGRLWQEGRAPDSAPEPLDRSEFGVCLLSLHDYSLHNALRILGGNAETKAIVLDALIKGIEHTQDQTARDHSVQRVMGCRYLTAKDRGLIISKVMDRSILGLEILSWLDDLSARRMRGDDSLNLETVDGFPIRIEKDVLLDALAHGVLASANPALSLVQVLGSSSLKLADSALILQTITARTLEGSASSMDWKRIGHHLLSLDDSALLQSLRTLMDSETKALMIDALVHGISSQPNPEATILRIIRLSRLNEEDYKALVSAVMDPARLGHYILKELRTNDLKDLLYREHAHHKKRGTAAILDAVAKAASVSEDPAQAIWRFVTTVDMEPSDFDSLMHRLTGKTDPNGTERQNLIKQSLRARLRDELSRIPSSNWEVDWVSLTGLKLLMNNSGLLPLELNIHKIKDGAKWLQDFFSSHDPDICSAVLDGFKQVVETNLEKVAQSAQTSSSSQLVLEKARMATAWNAMLRELTDCWDALPIDQQRCLYDRLLVYSSGIDPDTGGNLSLQEAVSSGFLRKPSAFAYGDDPTNVEKQSKPAARYGPLRRANSLDSSTSYENDKAFKQTRKLFIDLLKDENIVYLKGLISKELIDPWSSGAAIGAYNNQTLFEFAQSHGGVEAKKLLDSIRQASSALNR